jgi:hypothetical protein
MLWTSVLFYLIYERVRETRYLVASGILGGICIAFKLPGGVIVPLILAAILAASPGLSTLRVSARKFAIFFLSLMVSLTVVAPEWITVLDSIQRNFAGLLGGGSDVISSDMEISEAAKSVSAWGGPRWGYVRHLTKDYNILLTACALAGIAVALYRRHRWDIILGGFVIGFVFIMSLADRVQAERYLLPMMPAAWLLASSAVFYFSRFRSKVAIAALIIIAAIPSIHLLQSAVERMSPDTRVTAKEWIESNVLPESKILMDGMRYRYIPSPPLNPSSGALSAKVAKASKEGEEISRGVSDLTLSIYKEAMQNVDGPTYELHSTEHGLKIEPIAYYIDNCFDYVVTSSLITQRFGPGSKSRQIAPQSAVFYDALSTDPRFELVYSIGPRPWIQSGPEIDVYKVKSRCAVE